MSTTDTVTISKEEYERLKSYVSEEQVVKLVQDMIKEQLPDIRKSTIKEVLTMLVQTLERVKASAVIDFVKSFASEVYEVTIDEA